MSWLKISLSVLALFVIVKAQKSAGYEQLDSALHHYDTLHSDHIEHSYSTGSTPYSRYRYVRFNTLGRDFHLSLVHNDGIFSRDFGAHIVGRDGQPRKVHLDKHEFYHGHLHDDYQSSVTAHISESGVLTASIITASEVYHIEPSHLYVREPHPFHMIAYRSSHVKDRLSGARMDYVTGPTLPKENKLNSKGEKEEALEKSTFQSFSDFGEAHRENRLKRQALPGGIAGTSCPMILVADFNVFNNFGSNERSIMVQLVQLVDSIDKMIYRPTSWIVDTSGGTVNQLGIEIRNITVHNASSDPSDLRTWYNRDIPSADADDLLGDMRFGSWSAYCLAHLFTDRNFASGLLGLANIASPQAGQTGGICSSAFRDFGFDSPREVIYNTGLTTFNNNGQRMVMSELVRVTGHELGHSWGSHHDPPGDAICRDKYLMNEFAQDGSEPTHMMFSSCSRTSIGQVLLNKATCFSDPDPCGNFEIDDDEDCDAGPEGDACCDSRCNFVDPTFTCSDLNHACCKNCSIASAGVVCQQTGRISINCNNDTLCDGEERTCPVDPPPAPEGMPCIGPNGGGTCRRSGPENDTQCLSVCEVQGQVPCACGEPYECVVCCQDRNSPGTCSPVTVLNGSLPLSNGAPCSNNRVCIDGQCTDSTQDVIERFFNIIVNLDINAFGVFVRENIIGFVLIFTIPCWCLGSCLVYCCIDDGWESFMSLLGRKAKEETDAHIWFMERVQRYKRWMKRKLDETHIPLLSDAIEAETAAGDNETSSKEDLIPVDPVDDLPAPTYI